MLRLRSVSTINIGCYSANCENSKKSGKLLVTERDSDCHEAVVTDSEVHKADEVSEVRLVEEIEDKQDEDCESSSS